MTKNKLPKSKLGLTNIVRYSSLGFEMLGIMGILIFLGFKIDDWLNLEHVFLIIFTILSIFAALYYAIRKIK